MKHRGGPEVDSSSGYAKAAVNAFKNDTLPVPAGCADELLLQDSTKATI
jgi:hypothetical protein